MCLSKPSRSTLASVKNKAGFGYIVGFLSQATANSVESARVPGTLRDWAVGVLP